MARILLLLLSLWLVLSLAIAASSNDEPSSELSSKSFKRIEAVKVSKSSKNANKPTSTATDKDVIYKSDNLQRKTVETRTTIEGIEMHQLSPAESLLYEDCFKDAFQVAQSQVNHHGHVTLRSVIVEDEDGSKRNNKKNHNRSLRGGNASRQQQRALWFSWGGWSFSWLDLYAFAEFYSCSRCGTYDDDDDYHVPTYDTQNTDDRYESRLSDYDDDIDADFYVHGNDPNFHRYLAAHEKSLGEMVCECLKQHDLFRSVEKCTVEFIE